jgi:hypothetical protein
LLSPVPDRLCDVIDNRVFEFAQAAQRHYRSNDLVILLALGDPVPALEAVPCERLTQADLPGFSETLIPRKDGSIDPLGFFEPPEALVPAGLGATRQAPSP